MVSVFERVQRRQPRDKLLLNLSDAEYLLLFHRAAANLQVDVVPCRGRHSGASVESAENLRTLESTQKRGRWKSAKSVRRYVKSGRVNQSWSELAPLVHHPESIATKSCPRYCFAVTPLRHRLGCFVFCEQSLQRKHRIATVFITERYTVRQTRSFFQMTTQIFDQNSTDFVHLGK